MIQRSMIQGRCGTKHEGQVKAYKVGGDQRSLHARSRFNVGKHQWGLRPLARWDDDVVGDRSWRFDMDVDVDVEVVG